jgi:hypothetical protein
VLLWGSGNHTGAQGTPVHGRGGHERLLPLSDETISEALRVYLGEYPATVGPLIRSYIHPDRGMGPGTIGALVGG